LRQKCKVYAAGCQKRGRHAEANHYEQLSADASGWEAVLTRDSRLSAPRP